MTDCNDWIPAYSQVSRTVVSDTVLNTFQSLSWTEAKMDVLQEMGGWYLYEIRRSENYWNFLQVGIFCPLCFVEYTTNFPNPWMAFVEEEDVALSYCCLKDPEDEEAQMNVYIPDMEATWYYVSLKMIRLEQDEEFTLWSESEWCCSINWCNFGDPDCFKSCTMTTQTFTS